MLLHKTKLSSGELEPYQKRLKALGAAMIAVFCLVSAAVTSLRTAQATTHVRDNYEALKELGGGYRQDFTELTNYLRSRPEAELRVVGTFDPQLFSWWRAFAGRNVYITDNFSTTVSGTILEDRLISLCKIAGMSEENFVIFTESFLGASMWSHIGKLNPIPALLSRDFSAYAPKDQELLKRFGPLNSWELSYTVAYREELNRRFRETSNQPLGRLDAVVLTNDSFQKQLMPNAELFKLTFENNSFRVFLRQDMPLGGLD